MKKSIVSISKGTDVGKMVEEVLAPLGGVESLIKPKSTVVLKPNAGHVASAETSVNTNPEVIAAVIKEIRKAGPVDRKDYIEIGDGDIFRGRMAKEGPYFEKHMEKLVKECDKST